MTGIEQAPAPQPKLLPHLSINPEASQTVLLIHGAFSSSAEWDLVGPHLGRYHLLLPDLPAHGKSVSIQPFDVATSSQLIADLIQARTRNGKAHVVGFSLGSIVAAHLASHHEEVVSSLLVSGFIRLPPSAVTNLLPYFFGLQNTVTSLIPRSLLRSMMDGTDIAPSKWTSKLSKEISAAIVSSETLDAIPARTLVIAATKGRLIPSNDRVEDARKLYEAAQRGNKGNRLVEHPGMRHPWNRQNPALFAMTVEAWIEGEELPADFRDL